MKKILVVEDDVDLNLTITKFLKLKEFEVEGSFDAQDAINLIYEQNFDLIILDVKLPKMDGFEVARRVREFSKVPIVFLTSLNSQKNIQEAFLSGADDYITKPFSLQELLLRINAIIRRVYQNEEKIKISKELYFDVQKSILYKNSKQVNLTKKELKLLEIFLKNPNKILSKDEIFDLLYEYEEFPNESSLRVFINKLRNIIGKEKIKTVKNFGYQYVS